MPLRPSHLMRLNGAQNSTRPKEGEPGTRERSRQAVESLAVDAATKKGTTRGIGWRLISNRATGHASAASPIDRGRPPGTRFAIPWPGEVGLAKWVPFRGIHYDATERNGAATTATSHTGGGMTGLPLSSPLLSGWSNGCGWCGGCTVPGGAVSPTAQPLWLWE